MKKKLILILLILIVLGVALFIGKNDIYKYLYPKKYSDYVEFYSKEYNLDENLVYSIIKAESKFKEDAVSRKGAKGLMQIGDGTRDWAAEELKLEKVDIFKPQDNIRIGCWYLRYLLDMYDGKLETSLAAYNAGCGNVNKWLADSQYSSDGETLDSIPYKETDGYVEKTVKYMSAYEKYYKEL